LHRRSTETAGPTIASRRGSHLSVQMSLSFARGGHCQPLAFQRKVDSRGAEFVEFMSIDCISSRAKRGQRAERKADFCPGNRDFNLGDKRHKWVASPEKGASICPLCLVVSGHKDGGRLRGAGAGTKRTAGATTVEAWITCLNWKRAIAYFESTCTGYHMSGSFASRFRESFWERTATCCEDGGPWIVLESAK